MTTNPRDNIIRFPGLENPGPEANSHRDVIASLTGIIQQMSELVKTINEGPMTDVDRATYASWLCSASALCLRAQLEYFDQFVGDSKTIPGASSFNPPQPPGPAT